jgi:alpha-N-arabinofuranosidase
LSKPIETQIALRGAAVASASGTVLAASDMHAHNTFDHPNAVMSTALATALSGGLLHVTLLAASVTKLEIALR